MPCLHPCTSIYRNLSRPSKAQIGDTALQLLRGSHGHAAHYRYPELFMEAQQIVLDS